MVNFCGQLNFLNWKVQTKKFTFITKSNHNRFHFCKLHLNEHKMFDHKIDG